MQNPFKMLGDLNKMRQQAKTIQEALEKETFTATYGSATVQITGNQNITSVAINNVENDDVKHAANDAIKQSQRAAAGKLSEISKNLGIS